MLEVGSDASVTALAPIASSYLPEALLSRPEAGRTLASSIAKFEGPIRAAVDVLFPVIRLQEGWFETFDCTPMSIGGACEQEELRLSWLIANASVLFLRHATKDGFSVVAALRWFFSSEIELEGLLQHVEADDLCKVDSIFSAFVAGSEIHDLLPYLIEPHGHVPRSAYESCEVAKSKRQAKRLEGVYYTPSDVAEFMVGSIGVCGAREKWLDPACGTGVFLREIFRFLLDDSGGLGCTPVEIVERFIFGIDKSALSTDSAAFVLLNDCLAAGEKNGSPFEIWKKIKKKIICMDSLRLTDSPFIDGLLDDETISVSEAFPALSGNGFDCVVMNPPYSTVEVDHYSRRSWKSFSHLKAGAVGDIHLPFFEMCSRLVGENGRAAAVLPLSVGTNTTSAYVAARQEVIGGAGRKEFLFFDREPQALFGEDIKTRNVIFFLDRRKGRSGVFTSRLLKWSGEQRSSIFSRERVTEVGAKRCQRFIPKLGGLQESNAYEALMSGWAKSDGIAPEIVRMELDEIIAMSEERNSTTLVVSSTAYNFLNCFFASALPASPTRPYSKSPASVIFFDRLEDAEAAYSLIVSRISFWLWHVDGDGFHLTNDFLRRLPVWRAMGSSVVKERLAGLGRKLWAVAETGVMGSVNAGKQTYSFSCPHDLEEKHKVDEILIELFGLDASFSVALDDFVFSIVSVNGRDRGRKV